MMYAFLGKQIKIVFQGMVVFLFLGSLQASQRYEFSDEERLLLHNTAQACDLEDMSYIRTHSLNKEDALSFVLAPKGDVSQIPESSLLSAKALVNKHTSWWAPGEAITGWECLLASTIGTLESDGKILYDALVALAYIRGIEPCQKLLTRLCGEEGLAVEMNSLRLQ